MSRPLRPLEKAPLLHISVQESLRSYIEENALEAGAPLPPESFLAQQLGVGRNSVREAIKALESLGVLETRRGVGVFVKEFSFKPLLDNLAYGLQASLRDIEELRQIRLVLETGLIDKTIEMISAEDLEELRQVTERMRAKAESNQSFAQEDQQFHKLLFRCQNNQILSSLIDIFWTAYYKTSGFADLENPNPLSTWRDHHDIVEAVAARDVDAARERLATHYSGIQQVVAQSRSALPPDDSKN